jgi:hypothetical protein
VVVNFSETMNAGTVTTSTFTLTPTSGGAPISASVVYSAGSATLDPSSNLAYSTSYTVNVTNGATDLAGNPLVSFASSFTTVAPPDLTPPTVSSVSPVNRSVNNSTTAQVRVTFNEPIDQATINSTTFTVKEFLPNGALLNGTRTYDALTNTIIFTPTNPYLNHESYTVKVTTGLKDVAGNPLAAAFTSCFTPTAGAGNVISLNGFWSGNDACLEVHWHMPILQTGNTLSLDTSKCTGELCTSYAVSEAGRAVLGGASCRPTSAGGPTVCELTIVSLSGTISGSAINFTITYENGLTFTFNGTFSQTGTFNPYLTGTMSGATLLPVGLNFERQGL